VIIREVVLPQEELEGNEGGEELESDEEEGEEEEGQGVQACGGSQVE